MGTSQSSGGPGGNVPMVPPWTPDPPPGGPPPPEGEEGAPPGDGVAPAVPPPAAPPPAVPLAPRGRFGGTRLSIGEFARSGDGDDMRRGLGRYVGSGYGGGAVTTQRFGGTASTAAALGSALSSLASGQAPAGSPLDPKLLAGRSAEEVMDAVVEAIRPPDGTQDAEAERASVRDALTELLTQFPEADLLNLEPDQRTFAIERYAAFGVFRRFELDIGQTILEKAPSVATAAARLKEIRDYIKETVAASFRKLRDAGRPLTAGRIADVVRDALRDTFDVFEGYAE